jgi:methyltransferase
VIAVYLPALVAIALLLIMLGEARLSRTHERALRAQGAVEPQGDVYRAMQLAYPACFVAMGLEGLLSGMPARGVALAGLALLVAAKALKYWAIATLGPRWTFRVLVPPRGMLVRGGPYALVRHPNYVGVVGELIGMGLLVGAPWSGIISTTGFGILLLLRIRVEERALGAREAERG